ncbi:hypothetical protein Pcinc_016760 [Petrolisthes cinctipes]|uniref:Uncharacterized protein n=1 Tax=Petrolisthes cinctipes TaxID=88211 RepID=A0AAE1FRM5_PETCI|nr:hypothetical protein Pcinc_016760 [Petrolisthes cinctipes]
MNHNTETVPSGTLSCLGDFPVYRCVDTEQLRTQANIPDPVTHVSETTEPHTPPLLDSQGQLTNPGRKESQWEDLEKGELISLVEKLTEEASRSNIKIKSLQHDRDLIIQHKEVFASALRIGDRLIASKLRESIVITKNQPVSALASTIAATGTDTTPPVIPTITSATGTDTRPTSQVTIPTVTNNTTTAQSDTEENKPQQCRRVHTVEDCHHRTADQRQERLLRQILAEGRHSDPPFPSAALLQPNLPLQPILPQSRPSFPQPDTWRQNQGVQWISPHQYPYITTPHPNPLPFSIMARPGPGCARHQLKILSANVRGLRTNIGDLTHNCVLRHSIDIVVVTETWLNSEVEPTFGKICGYTNWTRRDRLE